MNGKGRVLVTGGSGYLGGWCIVTLLEQGYSVRTTVRDLAREQEVRTAVASATDPGDRLEVVAADLTSDAGWPEAVAGCDYVLHVASPFPPQQPKDPDELIVPAREGTLRVLRAAFDAAVKRVVVTSSVAAVRGGHQSDAEHPLTEEHWSDPDDTNLTPYSRSKTHAERAAWEFVREQGAEGRLAVVNPGAIIGPLLSPDASYSIQAISRMLDGDMPGVPKLGFSFVDVRDVADLHVRAMTAPEAGGERFIAVHDWLWFSDVAEILRERLGERASKVPTRGVPSIAVRALSLVQPELRSVTGDLGKRSYISSEKAKSRLGWSPRPVADSVAETAETLLAMR
jgi:nucleoside-diphosphate-sugar epimerase